MRDLNLEFQDSAERKYAYDFDYILRGYFIQALSPYFVNARNALEMGCYQGEFTKSLLAEFENVAVIEGSSQLIETAKKNVNSERAKFHHGTFESIQFNERFDNIFLMHTLEHLDDPTLVLGRIREWLTDTGRLFLVCPNANAASRQIAVKMGMISHNSAVTEGERTHGHRKTYSLDTLEAEARTAGLKVVTRGGVFFKPLANFQFDMALKTGVIDQKYLDGCYHLGMVYPDLSASIYLVCSR